MLAKPLPHTLAPPQALPTFEVRKVYYHGPVGIDALTAYTISVCIPTEDRGNEVAFDIAVIKNEHTQELMQQDKQHGAGIEPTWTYHLAPKFYNPLAIS